MREFQREELRNAFHEIGHDDPYLELRKPTKNTSGSKYPRKMVITLKSKSENEDFEINLHKDFEDFQRCFDIFDHFVSVDTFAFIEPMCVSS